MIHRFLSMNPDWVDTISELQPFTQSLPPLENKIIYILHTLELFQRVDTF